MKPTEVHPGPVTPHIVMLSLSPRACPQRYRPMSELHARAVPPHRPCPPEERRRCP